MTGDEWEGLQQEVRKETKALDQLMTTWQEEHAASGKRIFCAPGCSSCCTLYVQATLVEAQIVAAELDSRQLTSLASYVLRQRESLAGEDDFLALLRKQRSLIGPCPFLDQSGCCSIYALRPLACRALLSTKDPAWCSVDFRSLDPLEKQLYLASLDRPVVAFPVHYVAGTQRAAQDAAARILAQMQALPGGVAVSGNFPLLVYLLSSGSMATVSKEGAADWQAQIEDSPFFHPLLLEFQRTEQLPPPPCDPEN